MQNCVFCNSDSVLDPHHVCWWFYKSKRGRKYMIRSWKASLVIPICRKCHDIYHDSPDYDTFISKFPVGKERNNIIRLFPYAKQIIEDAIRLSYLLPLVDPTLCGKSYFLAKAKISGFEEAIKIASRGNVENHMWGIFTNRTTVPYEPHYTINDSAKNYEYLRYNIKLVTGKRYNNSRGETRMRRSSKEALVNYIQYRRHKSKYPKKFRNDEFDYALCRMVAAKELTFDALEITKTVGRYMNGNKKKKSAIILYYKATEHHDAKNAYDESQHSTSA